MGRLDYIPSFSCLAVGALFLLGAVLFLRGSLDYIRHAAWTRGQVIENAKDPSSGWSIPVIVWTDRAGAKREYRGLGTSTPVYKTGEDIGLYYFPGQPDRIRLDTVQGLWLGVMVCGGIGGIFLIVGALLWQVANNQSVAGALQYLFGGVAVLAFIGAMVVALQSFNLLRAGLRTEGTVVSFWSYKTYVQNTTQSLDRDLGPAAPSRLSLNQRTIEVTSPIVRFRSADGAEIEIVGRSGSGLTKLGEPVPVVYYPDRPDGGRVNTFIDLWIVPVVLSGIGLLGLLAVWLVRLAAR